MKVVERDFWDFLEEGKTYSILHTGSKQEVYGELVKILASQTDHFEGDLHGLLVRERIDSKLERYQVKYIAWSHIITMEKHDAS